MNAEARPQRDIGRWLVLTGAILSAVSAVLPWARQDALIPPTAAALVITSVSPVKRGFDLYIGVVTVGWLVVLCGVISCAMLLLDPCGLASRAGRTVQMSMGGFVFALALLNLGPFLGVFLALLGGLAIAAGAALRPMRGEPASGGMGRDARPAGGGAP